MIKDIDKLVKQLTHGVYVVGVRGGERQNAFTAAWVMQVSFKPVMLAISISPEHYSYDLLQAGKICAVSVLADNHLALAEHFGSSVNDKMTGFDWMIANTGAPILADSLGYFDCRLSHMADGGDHKIAVCEVVAAAKLHEGCPMLYGQTDNMDDSKKLY